MQEIFAVLKRSEGGMGVKTALLLLKQAGIRAEAAGQSCYVGHSSLTVTGTRREVGRAERILYRHEDPLRYGRRR